MKLPEKADAPDGNRGDAAARMCMAIHSQMVARSANPISLAALDHDDPQVRHDAARNAWAIVRRLNEVCAHRLYHRFASDPPGSPEWRVAELCRLRLWILGAGRPVETLDRCPAAHCERSGLWFVSCAGEVVCGCGGAV